MMPTRPTWKFSALALVAASALLLSQANAYADGSAAKSATAPTPRADEDTRILLAENPLQKWLKNLFNPGRNRNQSPRQAPGNTEQTAADAALDSIDRSAPRDPQQAKWLSKATERIEQRDWKAARELLQLLLDQPEDSLVRRQDGRWISVHAEANRMLGEFPPELLDTYRLHYGAQALQLLDEAREKRDAKSFVEVATRYFYTEAGQEAANYLGTLHFDRAEFGLAARWFSQLIGADAPITENPRWRLKAAIALDRAGQTVAGKSLLAEMNDETVHAARILDGQPVRLDSWLAESRTIAIEQHRPLGEWPLFLGSPSRTAAPGGGEPLLLPRWSQPLTYSRSIAERVATLVEDLSDQGRATIPAWFPLMVDGKVVYRTMAGVQVVDAQTGELLWETRDETSPEQLLNGDLPATSPRGRRQIVGFRGALQWHVDEDNHDRHPLTGLLFRNGTYGILSSDGVQLFVLENDALLAPVGYNRRWGGQPEQNDPFRRDWSSNRITSYDLSTGHPRWSIGGAELHERFDQPLAGFYFLGTPVREADDLFVVAEKDNEIRLFALDAQTGHPSWSELIAVSQAKIEEDVTRRLWTAQVAAKNGVVVCPTTVGWLVGVDRVKRSILWAHRYHKPLPEHRQPYERSLASLQELNSRWAPSAPLIADNRVVYTPSESTSTQEPVVVCVDLFSGEPLWQARKGDRLYLAGLFNGQVLLVGKQSVQALSLEDGKSRWTLPIPPEAGMPTGMGVAVEGRYYLPLRSGQIWSIDTADGSVAGRSYLREGSRPLGNLGMYQGMLLSLSPFGLATFEQREAIEAQIRERKADDPRDPWALLRDADINLLQRNYNKALHSLRQIDAERLMAAEQRRRYREAMVESLAATVRSDFEAHEQELAELQQIAQTDREKLLHRRLSAERLHARGDYEAAFDCYVRLGMDTADTLIRRNDGSDVEVRLDRWVAGKLQDLWSLTPAEVREKCTDKVDAMAQQALGGTMQDRKRFVTLFGFHPAAFEVSMALVETYAKENRLVSAENLLLRLMQHSRPNFAAAATARLALLLLDYGLDSDAAHFHATLHDRFTEETLQRDAIVAALVQRLYDSGRVDSATSAPRPVWTDGELEVVRVGGARSSPRTQELVGNRRALPFFQTHRIEVDAQHDRLAVVDAADESLDWLTPLRTSGRPKQDTYAASSISAHQLLVLHGDVLHSLSPVERIILWTAQIDSRGGSFGYYRSPAPQPQQPLQKVAGLLASGSLEQQAEARGMLAAANSRYVCLYGRRQFTVLDASSGRTLWTKRQLLPNTSVYGTEEVLFVVPDDGKDTLVLRALDGKPLDMPNAADFLSRAGRILDRGVLLFEKSTANNENGSRGAAMVVRLYDPVQRENRWRQTFPADVRVAIPGEGWLAALTDAGRLSLVDIHSGAIQTMTDALPDEILRLYTDVYAVLDRHNVYVAVSRRRRRSHYQFGELASVPVNGTVFAFGRRTGKLLWDREVEGQHLIDDHLSHLPVLVFAQRKYVRKGIIHQGWIDVLAVDKRNGRLLAEKSLPMNSAFHSLNINMREPYVELSAYDQRLRLMPRDRASGATQ